MGKKSKKKSAGKFQQKLSQNVPSKLKLDAAWSILQKFVRIDKVSAHRALRELENEMNEALVVTNEFNKTMSSDILSVLDQRDSSAAMFSYLTQLADLAKDTFQRDSLYPCGRG